MLFYMGVWGVAAAADVFFLGGAHVPSDIKVGSNNYYLIT